MNFPPSSQSPQPQQPSPVDAFPSPQQPPSVGLNDNDVRESFAALALNAHSTRILLITFGLICFLAIAGILLSSFLGVNDDIFHDAIRIVGIGGPASSGADAISNAIGQRTGQRR